MFSLMHHPKGLPQPMLFTGKGNWGRAQDPHLFQGKSGVSVVLHDPRATFAEPQISGSWDLDFCDQFVCLLISYYFITNSLLNV